MVSRRSCDRHGVAIRARGRPRASSANRCSVFVRHLGDMPAGPRTRLRATFSTGLPIWAPRISIASGDERAWRPDRQLGALFSRTFRIWVPHCSLSCVGERAWRPDRRVGAPFSCGEHEVVALSEHIERPRFYVLAQNPAGHRTPHLAHPGKAHDTGRTRKWSAAAARTRLVLALALRVGQCGRGDYRDRSEHAGAVGRRRVSVWAPRGGHVVVLVQTVSRRQRGG